MSHFKAHATNSYADETGNYVILIDQYPEDQIPGGPLSPVITIKVDQPSWNEWSSKKQHWFHVQPPLLAGNVADPTQIYELEDFDLQPHSSRSLFRNIFIAVGVGLALLALLFNWRKRGSTKEGDQKK